MASSWQKLVCCQASARVEEYESSGQSEKMHDENYQKKVANEIEDNREITGLAVCGSSNSWS